jgi:RimJ/RimL family protein N-acetyltransferase
MRNLLVGDNVRITAVKDSDLDILQEWFNDVFFMRTYDMMPSLPKGSRETREVLDYYLNSQEAYILAIRSKDNGELIGVAGFDEIVWSSAVATVFIGIGNYSYRGKGIGREALRLLLDFGFNELNFHRIQLDVIEYNHPAVKLYEGAGFVREGVYREFIHRDGKRYDMYLYGLLRSEWKNNG